MLSLLYAITKEPWVLHYKYLYGLNFNPKFN